jgi:catechol 2,3-dioxygenase-like lactoylglutathione lyase family enzyme
MALNGIDAVTLGVEDLDAARRFLNDWGVIEIAADAAGARYQTKDGCEIIVRAATDPSLPPAIEPGSTVRRVVWGAADQGELDKTLAQLSAGWDVETAADGLLQCRDPDGLTIAFRVSKRRPIAGKPTGVNVPGHSGRVDQRAPFYDHAEPIKIGHVVLFASDLAAMDRFYRERLGFVLSDSYPGAAVFLRCSAVGVHHNLFLLSRPGKPGLNHVAYTVGDIHEVFGGGLDISRKGWTTEIGPGRHPISSAYFWYFQNPCGGLAEYYTDEDHCTEAWEARDFERSPEMFAEWAVAGGIDGTTRRQGRGNLR